VQLLDEMHRAKVMPRCILIASSCAHLTASLLLLPAAVYTFGGKPVAGKVVTFTVTDSKTGAVKTYTGTTDANGVARVNVDASSIPAVADVYASVPSSKPDANGPVAATLAPGSGELRVIAQAVQYLLFADCLCPGRKLYALLYILPKTFPSVGACELFL
jgi:hypothetical protein